MKTKITLVDTPQLLGDNDVNIEQSSTGFDFVYGKNNVVVITDSNKSVLRQIYRKIRRSKFDSMVEINCYNRRMTSASRKQFIAPPVLGDSAIYFLGDSNIAGVGVAASECLVTVVGAAVTVPVINLAAGGSGLLFSINMLRKLPADSVCVFGLTSITRVALSIHSGAVLPFDNSDQPHSIEYDYPIDKIYLSGIAAFWEAIMSEAAMKKIKILFLDFDFFQTAQALPINPGLLILGKTIDYGNDASYLSSRLLTAGHPGPKSHQQYAAQILEKLGEIAPDILK